MMKKIFVSLLFLGIFGVCVFSQDERVTRPRVVVLPTSTPTPSPFTERLPVPPPPPVPVEDDEELRIETTLVKLPVSVLDGKGRFISNLTETDFEIFENGIPQSVDYFNSVESPFTVILLLDVSPSTKYKISEIQDAAISFVDQLRGEDQLIVVTFSDKIDVISRQKTNFHRVRSAIRETKFGVGTSMYDAVDFSIKNLLNDITGRKAIVILSDGVDTSSKKTNYVKTVREAEKIDALIYAVRYNTFEENQVSGTRQYSIGSSPQEYRRGKNYLTDLTEVTGGRLYEAETTQNIEQAFKNIADELRQQYSLGYYPEKEGEDGERRLIKIGVKKPDLIVKSKQSYTFSTGNQK